MDEALRRARRTYLANQDAESSGRYIAALERVANLAPQHQYEIQNTLIISSSHINEEESIFLDQGGNPVWASYAHGWTLWIPDDREFFQQIAENYPTNIATLMHLAKSLDCEFLRIDSDGPVYKGLPTWEW